MRVSNAPIRQAWRHKATLPFLKADPIQNDWYTAYEDTEGWKRLLFFLIAQSNTPLDVKTINTRWTIDGESWLDIVALDVLPVWNWIYRGGGVGLAHSATVALAAYATHINGTNIKLEMRITDAPAAGQFIFARTTYEELETI